MPTKRKPTRAAAGAGSIRKRKDGTWEGRYSMGYHPGTGKQVRKSVYGKSEDEVVKKLRAVLTGIDTGTYIEPSKLTVGQWLDIWSSEYLGNVKPRTLNSYQTCCRVHLKPALGAVKLSALSAHMIQALFNRLQRGEADKPGLSPKTLKNLCGVLHRALQQAVELNYIRFNPCDACKLPRVEKPEIKPLDDETIDAFIEAIDCHRWRVVFLVALFTGMRQGELLGLTWPCVDFQRGTILIKQQLQKDRNTGRYALIAPKNNKSRLITPAPSVMGVLREHRRQQMEWQLMAGGSWEASELVFTNELGHNLSPQTVYLHFKQIAESIGVPASRFHDLRHTYAVAALRSGDDIKTVQENLGHHTASFTLDTYAHITERMKTESADRMERFIQSRKTL